MAGQLSSNGGLHPIRNLNLEFEMIALPLRRAIYGPLSIALAGIVLSGCGLSDYEAKMAAAQADVHRFDKENEYLAEPIEWPPETGVGKGPKEADLFFRPPKGIRQKAESSSADENKMYKYSAVDSKSAFSQVEVGAVNEKEEGDLFEFLLVRFGADKDKVSHQDRKVFGGRTLKVDAVRVESEGSSYSIYGWRRDGYSFAVIFKVNKSRKNEASEEALRLSLESIAVGRDAAERRRTFTRALGRGT
jgi:hypothetical protein